MFTAAEPVHVDTARTVFAYLVSASSYASNTEVTRWGPVTLLQGHNTLTRLPFLVCLSM
jgi:hypothetical protein